MYLDMEHVKSTTENMNRCSFSCIFIMSFFFLNTNNESFKVPSKPPKQKNRLPAITEWRNNSSADLITRTNANAGLCSQLCEAPDPKPPKRRALKHTWHPSENRGEDISRKSLQAADNSSSFKGRTELFG